MQEDFGGEGVADGRTGRQCTSPAGIVVGGNSDAASRRRAAVLSGLGTAAACCRLLLQPLSARPRRLGRVGVVGRLDS